MLPGYLEETLPCWLHQAGLLRKWVSKVLDVNEPKRGPPRKHGVLGAFSGGDG